MSDANEVQALERSFWEAMKQKNGDRVRELAAAEMLITSREGVAQVPGAALGDMVSSGVFEIESFELSAFEIVSPAPNVISIAYVVTTVRDAQTPPNRAAICSTWQRGADGWRVRIHCDTPL